MKIIQKGFNYSQDGPGNRLVYHLQGCNMKCPWCANPEGIPMEGVTMVIPNKETGKSKEKLSYIEMSVQEIVEEVLRSKMMFFENGGVTFTGGEPTMQWEELLLLMKRLKEENIHVAMENNGTSGRLEEMLPYIDYLIMDFKHPKEEIHQKVTGVSNKQTVKNLEMICKSGRQIAIRIPMIHGFNDTEEALEGFCTFFQNHSMNQATVEILPYHEYGKEKWSQCGLEYTVKDGFVEDSIVRKFEQAFRDIGVTVIHT